MKKLRRPLVFILIAGFYNLIHGQLSLHSESDNADLVKVYVKQDPATYKKSNTQNNTIEFAVQVAASSKAISETKARKDWEDLGHVYVQKENGMYKIRIGPFESQMEAKQILLKAKSKGRKDAFIVVLQGTQNDKPLYQSGDQKADHRYNAEKETTSAGEAEIGIVESTVMPDYKVRIASYLKPGAFNPDGMEQLGTLESYRKGDLTIMMIGGFHVLEDAQRARQIVISKGYKDAAIVVDHNGILEEVVIK
jgi:hypothetical protein